MIDAKKEERKGFQEEESKEVHVPALYQRHANTQDQCESINEKMKKTALRSIFQNITKQNKPLIAPFDVFSYFHQPFRSFPAVNM